MKSPLKYALAILPHIIVLLGIVLVAMISLGNRHRILTTATYTRFEVCALDIPAAQRKQPQIDHCWDIAERSTGVTVDHFDK